MNEEKYLRAYSRFLADNPHLDPKEAEKEFGELYAEGLYKLNDDYEKAEDLYEEAYNNQDFEEARKILEEAVSVCPYHYDSRILLAMLNNEGSEKRLEALEDIREEFKKWLKASGIDLDSYNGTLWNFIEARPYIRLLSTMTDEAISLAKYNDARKYAEMAYRLDSANSVDSLFDYSLTVILCGKYEFALNLMKDYNTVSGRYAILSFYSYVGMKDYKNAYKAYRTLYHINPYYCAFLTGMLDVEQNEVEEILNKNDFKSESFEEAVYYISRILPLTEDMYSKMDGYLSKYFDMQVNTLVRLPETDIIILTRVMADEGLSFVEINERLQLENRVLEKTALKYQLEKLVNKKYLEKRNDTYYITRLTYFIMKAATNYGTDETEIKE